MSTDTEKAGTPSTVGKGPNEEREKPYPTKDEILSELDHKDDPNASKVAERKGGYLVRCSSKGPGGELKELKTIEDDILAELNKKVDSKPSNVVEPTEDNLFRCRSNNAGTIGCDNRDIEANDPFDEDVSPGNENGDCSNESSENAPALDHSSSLSAHRNSVRTIPGAFSIENPMYESTIRRAILESNISSSAITGDSSSVLESQDDNMILTTAITLQQTSGGHEAEARDVVQAVCIDNQKVFEAKVIPSKVRGEDSEQKRSIEISPFKIAFVMFLMTIVIVLSIVLTHQGGGTDSNIEAPSSIPDFLGSTKALRAIVAPFDEDGVFDENSSKFSPSRRAALDWLLSDKIVSKTDPSVEWKLRQRYILALFYFSTNGPEWEDDYYFLSELEECDWQFVQTQSDMRPIGFDGPTASDYRIKGLICNRQGKVESMRIWWNGLTGTLPSEVSHFSDSLVEFNVGGGGMTGSIPPSFEKLTKLRILSVNDHCLSGSIPEFSGFKNLELLNLQANAELFGSLNWSCNRTDYKDMYPISSITVDNCGGCSTGIQSSIECDCCNCCTPENFECCNHEFGSYSSVYLDDLSPNGFIHSFEKQCLSEAAKQWVEEECPCVINTYPGDTLGDLPFKGECTTDCNAEGVITSYNF